MFNNLTNSLLTDAIHNKLDLINYIMTDVYNYIIECDNYKDALKELYVKQKNGIFACQILAICKQ